MGNNIIGLGLESSCDETSASITLNGEKILSNKISSQIDIHKEYFGVVPEIASRAHLEIINSLIDDAIKEAGISFNDIDFVAATNRPGLVGSLMISLQTAKTISYIKKIPLIAINHLEAHLYAPFLENNKASYPYIGLLISGGNTALYIVNGIGDMQLLGKTGDDAVGEAYDKVSKFLGLSYPGGPEIDRLAQAATKKNIKFPKIMPSKNDVYRFSYSGLKTAVINYIKKNDDYKIEEVAYAFQESALEILCRRVFQASKEYNINNIVVAGGVAANSRLRELLRTQKRSNQYITIPSPILCTDNAAMISGLGYHYFLKKEFANFETPVYPRIK